MPKNDGNRHFQGKLILKSELNNLIFLLENTREPLKISIRRIFVTCRPSIIYFCAPYASFQRFP